MTKNKWLKVIIFFYVLIGLFVAMIGGTTSDTVKKIGTQKVMDKVLKIKKAFRSNSNSLFICYLGDRGREKNIENWIEIALDPFYGEISRYIDVSSENSYLQSCLTYPISVHNKIEINTKLVELDIFSDYFLYRHSSYDEVAEKIYFVKNNKYIQVMGYVRNNDLNNKEIAFKIFTPEIEIPGDKKQLLFLPFALVIDIIAWPYRLNKIFNSSHAHW